MRVCCCVFFFFWGGGAKKSGKALKFEEGNWWFLLGSRKKGTDVSCFQIVSSRIAIIEQTVIILGCHGAKGP